MVNKWEHSWDELKNYHSITAHADILNKRSDEMWELVSVVMVKVMDDEVMRFYWKRANTLGWM